MGLQKGVDFEGRESRFQLDELIVKIMTTASIGFENGSWKV